MRHKIYDNLWSNSNVGATLAVAQIIGTGASPAPTLYYCNVGQTFRFTFSILFSKAKALPYIMVKMIGRQANKEGVRKIFSICSSLIYKGSQMLNTLLV